MTAGEPVPVVRPATRRDVPLRAALRRTWAEEEAGAALPDAGFEESFAEWFDREAAQRHSWLAECDGDAVGMLNLTVFTRMPRPHHGSEPRAGDQWGYLANVYVVPAHRDRGTGGRLLDAAVAHADAHRFARLVLNPSERSVPFYARAGFAPASALMFRLPR